MRTVGSERPLRSLRSPSPKQSFGELCAKIRYHHRPAKNGAIFVILSSMPSMRKIFYASIVLCGVLSVLFFVFASFHTDGKQSAARLITVTIGTTVVSVEIADTAALQKGGLSGRRGLAEDSGMLFVFEKPGIYGFWMKDMQFPIDILWISPNRRVIGVAESLTPSSFPAVYYPPQEISFALELPAGLTKRKSIREGMDVIFGNAPGF